MPPLSVLIKPSSSLCNMQCDYCFYCDEASKRSQRSFGFMSEETLKNVIRKTMLNAEGEIYYAFQGGEPTLRGLDFFEKVIFYQNKYNRNHIYVHNSLQTNGFLLDEDWCRFLNEHKFLVGLSLDGTQETHNKMRHDKTGGDTYERICHSAKLMDEYHVDYNILTVVTPLIAEHLSEIYAFYQRRGWNYQQYIACLDPLGEAHNQTPHALTPEVYGQFLIDLFRLWHRDLKKNRQPYIRQFENYLGIVAGYMPEACDQRGICGMQYVVEADGSVYPCDFYMLDEYCLGNFNHNRLCEIDQKRSEIRFIERSRSLTDLCRSCEYFWICRGGCQRNRDKLPGTDLYQNYFCQAYKHFFDACLPLLLETAKTL